jgi:UDP-N-acetylglucosamine diphosphorylase/glucosamine-1-phosphate N-acetyltransferase
MNILVFEDELVGRLNPISLARPAYAISCGAYRLIDWLRELELPLFGVVREYLQEIQRVDFPDINSNVLDGQTLLVNARLIPSVHAFQELRNWLKQARPGWVMHGQEVAALCLPTVVLPPLLDIGPAGIAAYLESVKLEGLPTLDYRLPLFEYPHDVIRANLEILTPNLEYRIARGHYTEIMPGVFAEQGATVGQHVVTETRSGPIVLDENASVGPFCYLRGPAFLGRGAKLIEHAAIKDAVSAGHTTKIGGEVEAAVIEPFTNKQHHGFLGHSYLGSWINLGAGTCNSDLKNTYGKVNLEYRGEKISTGMQFVGCMMGDYSKTAINTGIFTGKIIGAGSMLYGFVTTNVPSFVNYARLFGQVTELPAEVMVATQQRMFQRRNVTQRPCDVQLIHAMYELTKSERQLAGEPLSL